MKGVEKRKMKGILLDQNFALWTLMHHSSDAMMDAREKEIGKYDLSAIELRVLLQIPIMEKTTDEKVTASELSRWLFRKRSGISELLTRMGKRGLVRRVPQPGNKKSSIIEITEKGKKLREKGFTEGMTFVNEAISSLSEEERHQLWVIMGRLRKVTLKHLGITEKPPFPQFL